MTDEAPKPEDVAGELPADEVVTHKEGHELRDEPELEHEHEPSEHELAAAADGRRRAAEGWRKVAERHAAEGDAENAEAASLMAGFVGGVDPTFVPVDEGLLFIDAPLVFETRELELVPSRDHLTAEAAIAWAIEHECIWHQGELALHHPKGGVSVRGLPFALAVGHLMRHAAEG